uniref:TSA: Wollemia nobilis Ref_Wollemi_Transcript_7296_3157 transcribed RNA sequence n=1 Tax=Wollemia nobilis TaxID=56998 RepID=A0A0C9S9P0_9CONI
MAFGKHGRQEKQSSNSLCFRGTVVIFVGVCVLAVWMMNSSSPAPVERNTFNTFRKINPSPEIREKTSDSSASQEVPEKKADTNVSFEDSPGDLPEDAIKGDDNNPQIGQKPDLNKASDGTEEKKADGDENSEEGKRSDGDVNPNEENSTEDESLENGAEENANEEVGDRTTEEDQNKEKKKTDGEGKENTENMTQNEKDENVNLENDSENKGQFEKDGGNTKAGNETSELKDEKEKNQAEDIKQEAAEKKADDKLPETLPNGTQFELQKENTIEPGNWETQAAESKDEKERQETNTVTNPEEKKESSESQGQTQEIQSQKDQKSTTQPEDGSNKKENSNEDAGHSYNWQLCNVTGGPDHIPCLDNIEAIRKLHSTRHYEHRERHCPKEPPTCLVPLPQGYKLPVHWPESRDKVWYNNVPHTKLAEIKKHQNWMRTEGEYIIFPGGGTQFKNGALHYIDFVEETIPDIAWGKHSRVVLDVGCGVASFGGFLFEKDVLAMSFAPKDEHEAQVQLALERGIPAISAVMGTQRLPFPSAVFDIVHCARCRVPWHADGGRLLLELNRLLRPGGYFVWSATPVYQTKEEDVDIWQAMSSLTASICWNLLAKKSDGINEVGVAIYQKPTSNHCYEARRQNEPPLCAEADDPNAAWYVPMEACVHRVPTDDERGAEWPEEWPQRLEKVPSWLKGDIHERFTADTEHWKRIVSKSYLQGLGIDWSAVRNVMDMKSIYGGFAAALSSKPVWVMNVVPTDAKNTLPIIYDRGLFGIHHDWCESFNTYPRTYDLLHADHLFSELKQRCNLVSVMTEVDRILRPGGFVIIRDKVDTLNEFENMIRSLQWDIRMSYTQEKEGILCAQKTMWRPS